MLSLSPPAHGQVHRISFVVLLLVLAALLVPLSFWAFLDARWSGDAESCRAVSGACWASVGLRLGFLTFGFYPPEAVWRPLTALLLSGFAMALIVFCPPVRRSLRRIYATILLAFLASIYLLSGDGILIDPVPSRLWTGFSLTVTLAFGGFALALPTGILLAFGRHFGNSFVSATCTTVIEALRALPAVVTMFAVIVVAPYVLPEAFGESVFLRILTGFTLVMSAFYAEALRGALMTFGKGQIEAAQSLGLKRGTIHTVVILPQVITLSFPALMNLNLMVFKDTVLILTFGYYELLGAANASINTQEWSSFAMEMFFFVYIIFFLSGALISKCGSVVELELRRFRG